jgi:hypothetical protein
MARILSNPQCLVSINLHRLSDLPQAAFTTGAPGADGNTNRNNESTRSDIELAVPKPEEAPRVLNELIAAAQRSIEETRMVTAKVKEIFAKRR